MGFVEGLQSQGLTFEKAIIDVADAFAPGQVYVALSRVKSITGVFLKSKILHTAIITPKLTEAPFRMIDELNTPISELEKGKKMYIENLALNAFNMSQLLCQNDNNLLPEQFCQSLQDPREMLQKYSVIFCKEISIHLGAETLPDWKLFRERIIRAEAYFVNKINLDFIAPLKDFVRKNATDYKFRGQVNIVKNEIRLLQTKVTAIFLVKPAIERIITGRSYIPFTNEYFQEQQRPERQSQVIKINSTLPATTETQSLRLFETGKSIEEIAELRSLSVSTIEYHLASFIPTGQIKLTDIVSNDVIENVLPLVKQIKSPSIAQIRSFATGNLSMGKLYALHIYLK